MMKMILKLLPILNWHIKFERYKAIQKEFNEELMLVASHPKRWWNFCMNEDKKKKKERNRTNFYMSRIQFGSIETLYHIKLCVKT